MQLRLAILLLMTLALTPGCRSGMWLPFTAGGEAATALSDASAPSTREGSGVSASEPSAVQQAASFTDPNSFATSDGTAHPESDAVLQELQAIGAVDPAAAQQLVERLQDVKPSLRPLVAQQYRTSWEYHRQLTGQGDTSAASAGQPAAAMPVLPQAEPPAPPATLPAEEAATPPAAPHSTPPKTESPAAAAVEAPAAAVASGGDGSPADEGPSAPATSEVVTASYSESPKLLPSDDDPPNAEPMVESPRDWRVALEETIQQLSETAADDPHSTQEAYDHVRLRMLQLLAGEKQQALEPIPGLTPTEQGYWSNQLFALATLLNYDEQPDDERRASVAGEQLAEAAARLGELSTLRVRNVTFCQKVYGFGDYETLETTEFAPGQKVTLYAEMENFRSESTADGYHTSLATSYQVLDQGGHEVESGEFATVDDYCVGKRRDFYIEYTFQLPSRMYPNEYQLQLMIRDRLSGKIGKATVDFKIKE